MAAPGLHLGETGGRAVSAAIGRRDEIDWLPLCGAVLIERLTAAEAVKEILLHRRNEDDALGRADFCL